MIVMLHSQNVKLYLFLMLMRTQYTSYTSIYLNNMSTEFDQISQSIIQQQKRIEENQQQRNRKFNECLDSFLTHLKEETARLDATEAQNDSRNETISSAFENVYERIMTSSQVALRKVKQTCYEKKQFWNKLIQNNADLADLELKKDLYMHKMDAEERYYEAIEKQNVKKIPYNLLLGKLKQKNSLKEWQANNKKLEQEVVKGTKTLKQWKIGTDANPATVPNYYEGTTDSNYLINNFGTQQQSGPWSRPTLYVSRYNGAGEDTSVLNNFQLRRS